MSFHEAVDMAVAMAPIGQSMVLSTARPYQRKVPTISWHRFFLGRGEAGIVVDVGGELLRSAILGNVPFLR